MRTALLVMVALATTFMGCGGSDSTESAVVPPPTPTTSEPPSTDPPGGIELPSNTDIPEPTSEASEGSGGIELPENVPLDQGADAQTQPAVQYASWDEIQQIAQTTGMITVVDLWSLACEPCLKEFPGLVRLHQTHGDKVRCIAVDLDFDGRKSRPPSHYESEVATFLKRVGAAGFPSYISETPNEDVFASTKLVSIPAVLVFSPAGEIVKVFVDAGDSLGFTYENDVIPFVDQLLKTAA